VTTISLHRHLLSRGRMSLDLGQRQDARKLLERLLALPNLPESSQAEAHRLLGEIELGWQRFRRARRHFAAALRLESDRAEGYHSFALAVEEDPDGDPRKARAALRRATRLEPLKARYWVRLAHAELRLGRRKAALRHFRRAARLRPARVDTLAEIVDGLMALNRTGEARALILTARFRAPNDPGVGQLWSRFRLECLRRRQTAVRPGPGIETPDFLPFPGRDVDTLATPESEAILRADRQSRPVPHLFRLAGFRTDPRRAN
jgi:tetratricopeptide (TPR) repeat protein